MKLTDEKRTLVNELVSKYGNIVTRNQLCDFMRSKGVDFRGSRPPKGSPFPSWITNTKSLRAGRGQYDLSSLVNGDSADTSEKTEVEMPRVAIP